MIELRFHLIAYKLRAQFQSNSNRQLSGMPYYVAVWHSLNTQMLIGDMTVQCVYCKICDDHMCLILTSFKFTMKSDTRALSAHSEESNLIAWKRDISRLKQCRLMHIGNLSVKFNYTWRHHSHFSLNNEIWWIVGLKFIKVLLFYKLSPVTSAYFNSKNTLFSNTLIKAKY